MKGLLLSDEHDEAAPSGDPRVDEVSLEEEELLHCEWHDDDRKLGPLAFVDRDGVGEGNFIEFVEVVNDLPAIEGDESLALEVVDFENLSDVSIEDLLVVVVARLNDLVADAEFPTELLHRGIAAALGVQAFLEEAVHLNGAKRASVHRAEHLDVAAGVELPFFRNALSDEFENRGGNGLWLFALDEIKIRVLF